MKIVAIVLAALLLGTSQVASAQVEPVGTVSDDPAYVYRTFDSTEPAGAETPWGSVYSLEFTGYAIQDVTTAEHAFQETSRHFETQMSADIGAMFEGMYTPETVHPQDAIVVPTPELGSESFGVTIEIRFDGYANQYWGALAVREDSRLLLAYATSYDSEADLIGLLSHIVVRTLPRWDIGGSVLVESDGVRSGGIWNMVPTEAEVPYGFHLNNGLEHGPGPDAAAAGTPNDSAVAFDADIRIVLVAPAFRILDDVTCEGIRGFSLFREDGELAMMTPDGSGALLVTALDGPGQLVDDSTRGERVCVFDVTFEDLPVVDSYGFGPLGRPMVTLSYEDLSRPGVFEVVIEVSGAS